MEIPSVPQFAHEPFDNHEAEAASPELVADVAAGVRELGEEIARMRREAS